MILHEPRNYAREGLEAARRLRQLIKQGGDAEAIESAQRQLREAADKRALEHQQETAC